MLKDGKAGLKKLIRTDETVIIFYKNHEKRSVQRRNRWARDPYEMCFVFFVLQ